MTTYIIKVILCSAVFLSAYKFLLEKEKMHLFNRFYLLSSLLISFVIPVITFSSSKPSSPVFENELFTTNILQNNEITQILPTEQGTNYVFLILLTTYVIITTLFLFRFVVNLRKIFSKTLTHQTIPYKNSIIVLINEDLTPHSFLNYLFIQKKQYETLENEILIHEYAHIRQKHSYDILLIEILHAIFWFNPVMIFYKKAIQLNHEYLADEAVLNTTENISNYLYLLINKTNKNKTYNLTSQFNYSITKKRLLMMTKNKSFRNTLCRQIAVLPVLALSIFAFSTNTFAQDTLNVPTTKKGITPSTQNGVTQELLNEYGRIVNKTKNEKGFPAWSKFSEADKNRLETIYLAMSKDQQAKQIVIFSPAPPPLPRVTPTLAQIEAWKNSKIYGLWINEKRVSNSVLANYKNTDFAQVFVSKLGKNTVNYGKHYYQVGLMTTEHYDAYYKQTIESKKKYFMGIRMGEKEDRIAEKGKLVS